MAERTHGPTAVCPRCKSENTIRLSMSDDVAAWHCYDCRHSFDVRHKPLARRAADTRRKVPR